MLNATQSLTNSAKAHLAQHKRSSPTIGTPEIFEHKPTQLAPIKECSSTSEDEFDTADEELEEPDDRHRSRSSLSSLFRMFPHFSQQTSKEPREERCVWLTPPKSTASPNSNTGPREGSVGFLDLLERVSTSSSFYNPVRDERARRGRRLRRAVMRQTCGGLLDLPLELRERIYRAVYPLRYEKYINPIDVVSPDPQLLRTCRQIYTEARPFYDEAVQYLWSRSHFSVTSTATSLPELRNLKRSNLDLITRITVRIESEGALTLVNLIDTRGGWKVNYINSTSGQGTPASLGGMRTEYLCVHQRPAGAWKGMTWMNFHSSEDEMIASLDLMTRRTSNHAGVRDQILQVLLVTPKEFDRVSVRTRWRRLLRNA